MPEAPGWRIGGSAFYAASTAARLGASVGVVTAGGRESDALRRLRNTVVINLEAKRSTSFENIYEHGVRKQYLRARAPVIPADLIPPEWSKAPLVLLAPVADEVPAAMLHVFGRALIGVCVQGYMRSWEAGGLVSPKPWERANEILPHVAAVFFSEEDLGGHSPSWLGYCGPVLALTRAARGCDIIHCGKRRSVSGFAAQEVDPTGAGDVFAAAFMLALKEKRDPIESARFANCVASFSVAGHGGEALPALDEVQARLHPLSAPEP